MPLNTTTTAQNNANTATVQLALPVEVDSLKRILAAYQNDHANTTHLSESFEQWLIQIVLDWVREVEKFDDLSYEDR